jgi:hypothetical protein
MNTRPIIDESSGPVALSASFNSDASCFAVGLDTGFCGMSRAGLHSLCVVAPSQTLIFVPVFNSDPCELKASRGTTPTRTDATSRF